MRLWELTKLAVEGARRTPLRVSLTSFGVAIATGAVVSMVGFAHGLQEESEASFRKLRILSRISVLPKGDRVLDDDSIAAMGRLPRVVTAYPHFRLAEIDVTCDGVTRSAFGLGLPSDVTDLGYLSDLLTAGRIFEGTSTEEALMGAQLARSLGFVEPGAAVGRRLTLRVRGLTPGDDRTFRFEEQETEVAVVGVFEPPAYAFNLGGDALLLPIELIKRMPGSRFHAAMDRLKRGDTEARGYAQAVVIAERPGAVALVEKSIREMGFETTTLLSSIRDSRRFFVILDVVLTAVGAVALIVAGLGIVNTLFVAVLERTREIGVMKAMGASNGDVRSIFLVEALLVGLLGGTGGLALGRLVSWLLDVFVNSYARAQGVESDIAVFLFPAWLMGGALLFAVVVSVLSGVYPASRAARIDPIRALRGE